MSQLREVSAQAQGEKAERLRRALSRVHERFDHGPEVLRARKAKALIVLDLNLHSASSFFVQLASVSRPATTILSFLRFDQIAHLSAAFPPCSTICLQDGRLRTPYVKVVRVRTATQHHWAPDVVSLEVNASWGSPSVRSGNNTGMDALAFTKWMGLGMGLKELILSGTQWEKIDPGGVMLGTSIVAKSLRVLDLSNNCLSDRSVQRIASAILASPASLASLEVVGLDINNITEVGFGELMSLGSRARGVRMWSLRHNKVGNAACKMLGASELQPAHWDLRTNGITDVGCSYLFPVLEHMPALRLGGNKLGDIGVQHLAKGLGDKLLLLDLRHAHFGNFGAQCIGRWLMDAPLMEELLLSGNEIGAKGAEALARGWRWLRQLHHTDLSSNPIGSDGVACLAEELPYWKQSPFRLSMVSIGCGDAGILEVVDALTVHSRHNWNWEFELQGNDISAWHSMEVRRLLEEVPIVDEADIF